MEHIWAPWRMTYIKKKNKDKVCIFCAGGKRKGSLSKRLVLKQTKHAYVILNKYPYISGHLMVVPKRHVANLENLTAAEGQEIFELTQQAIRVAKKVIKPHGLNIGVNLGRSAGAGITKHIHYHIVPRWNGDTNFMPVIGKTRVLPEGLDKTYKILSPHF